MNSTLQVGSTPVIHRKSTRFLTYRCRSSDTFLSDCRVRSKENRNHLRSWIQLEREIFIPGLSQWQPHLTVAHQVRESEGIRGMNKFIINMQTYDLKYVSGIVEYVLDYVLTTGMLYFHANFREAVVLRCRLALRFR